MNLGGGGSGVQIPTFLSDVTEGPCWPLVSWAGRESGGRGRTHHNSSAQADNLAPHGAGNHVSIADGQERDRDQPQCVREVPRGVDSLPMGKEDLVLKPQPGDKGGEEEEVYPQHRAFSCHTLNTKKHLDRRPEILPSSLLCGLSQMLNHSGLQRINLGRADPGADPSLWASSPWELQITLLRGLRIGYPVYQMFTSQFITVAKLQL